MSKTSLILTLTIGAALLPASGDGPRAQTRPESRTGAQAEAQPRGELTEEFHQTYPLAAGGRVSLSNINGGVRVTSWDRNEVKVDAVKRAHRPERLREAQIKIEASAAAIRIETDYPDSDRRELNYDERENPASVEYTLVVPRSAVVEDFNLINGDLNIENLSGPVKASSINGRVSAGGLSGPVNLSVINGQLSVGFDRLAEGQPVTLSAVNGGVTLTLPSDASTHLSASTVHGSITNDFGLPVRVGQYVGRDLEGRIGAGSARVRLSSVNGRISVRRAGDNRPQSAVTNLVSETPDPEDDVNEEGDETPAAEVGRGVREALREAARAAAEAGEAVSAHEGVASAGGGRRQTARESNTFAVAAGPRVRLENFDGPVNVRAWDKSEVSYTATKRASGEREMQGIKILAQRGAGNDVVIRTEFDKSHAREHVARAGRTVVFSSGASVELDVFIPRNSTLSVSSGDGRVRVEGVSGALDLKTGDGPVDVLDGRGSLKAETGDGPVRVQNFEGDAEARTGDGRITLDGRFSGLSAHTGDGSISLSIPADLNVDIETDAQNVVSDGVATEDGPAAERLRRWRVGSGGNTLKLHTGDGQIVIRRR